MSHCSHVPGPVVCRPPSEPVIVVPGARVCPRVPRLPVTSVDGQFPDRTGNVALEGVARLVPGAVAGNLASLTESGNPADSGISSDEVRQAIAKAGTAYQKPEDGVPKTDLSEGVQTSLDLADAAVQPGDILTGDGDDKKIKSSLLPSYVDDVIEVANLASLPNPGEEGKIYVTLDTNKTYRWGGTAYTEISNPDLTEYAKRAELFPAWAKNTAYTTTSLVIHGNKIYRCTTAHTSGAEWDSTKWSVASGAEVLAMIRDYAAQSNKPQINGHTLTGNKTAADLGLATKADATLTERFSAWTFSGDTEPGARYEARFDFEYEGTTEWGLYKDGELFSTGSDNPLSVSEDFRYGEDPEEYTITATRTAQGYQLGSQTDKPLASEAEAEALRNGKLDQADSPRVFSAAANKVGGSSPVTFKVAAFDAGHGDFALTDGVRVLLRFDADFANGNLIQIGDGDAKGVGVIFGNTSGSNYLESNIILAGRPSEFVYSSTSDKWIYVGYEKATTLKFGLTKLSSDADSSAENVAATAKAVKTVNDKKLDKSAVVAPSTAATAGQAADAKATGDAIAALAPDWVSGSSYAQYDVVKYNGVYYYAKFATSGTTAPSSDTTHWGSLANLAALAHQFLPLTGGTMTGTLTLAEVDGGGTEIIKAYLGSESAHKFVVGVYAGNFYIGQYGYRLWLPYASGTLALLSQIGIPAFDSTATYAVGSKVVYDNAVWDCTTAVSTAGAWTGTTNWTKLFDLAMDSTPTANSNSLMTSGAIKTALDAADPTNKLNSTAAAPDFSATATYDVGNYCTYLGVLYECVVAKTTASATTPDNDIYYESTAPTNHWKVTDMTSPDATLDITTAGSLRVVAADGTILWQQGYKLASASSATLSNEGMNIFTFAAYTGVTAFDATVTYSSGDRVSYNGLVYKFNAAHAAGAWTGTDADVDLDTQAFSLPAAPNGRVGDFVLEIDNTANAVLPTAISIAEYTGTTIELVVPKGADLDDMFTFAGGTRCELYFTQTAFNVNSKPTWKVVRQDVEVAT